MKNLIILITLISLNLSAESLNIGFFGITAHTAGGDLDYSDKMKRKIDKNGVFAHHIEFNMTYVNKDSFLINATMLKDCFDNDAYFLGAGKQWEISENLYGQFSVGIYARKNFAKNVNLEIGSTHGKIDYIPTPWIGLKRNFPINNSWSISTQINTNVFLTHGTFGIEFNLP